MSAPEPDGLCESCSLDWGEAGEVIPMLGRCTECGQSGCRADCPCELVRDQWRAAERLERTSPPPPAQSALAARVRELEAVLRLWLAYLDAGGVGGMGQERAGMWVTAAIATRAALRLSQPPAGDG